MLEARNYQTEPSWAWWLAVTILALGSSEKRPARTRYFERGEEELET